MYFCRFMLDVISLFLGIYVRIIIEFWVSIFYVNIEIYLIFDCLFFV